MNSLTDAGVALLTLSAVLYAIILLWEVIRHEPL